MTDKSAAPNPVVTELVRNGVIAVTDEMKANLMRTAHVVELLHAITDSSRVPNHDGISESTALVGAMTAATGAVGLAVAGVVGEAALPAAAAVSPVWSLSLSSAPFLPPAAAVADGVAAAF